MARKSPRLQVLRKTQFVEVSTSPFMNGARSAGEACSALREHDVDVSLATLRWFQNTGLIDKPAKEGRCAVYPRAILDEVASLRMLQNLYGRSIEDLRRLRQRGITFTEVVQHLLRLERVPAEAAAAVEVHMVSPAWERSLERLGLVSEFFRRVLEDGVHPGFLKLRGQVVPIVRIGRR